MVVAVVVAAWSWPVQTTVAAGSVIEVLSEDPIGEGHPTLRTLDQLVPDGHQHLVEFDDAPDQEDGRARVLRYAVLGASSADVTRWRDSVATMPGVQVARVLMIDVTQRRPLGVVTARRILGVSPSPHLTDAELQAELDRVFAGARAIQVQRTPEGQRRLQVGDHVSLDVQPGARVSPLPTSQENNTGILIRGGALEGAEINGLPLDSLLSSPEATALDVSVDSLPPGAARLLRDRLNEHIDRFDELPAGVRDDSVRRWRLSDTLRFPVGVPLDSLGLADTIRIDSARTMIRILTIPDSL